MKMLKHLTTFAVAIILQVTPTTPAHAVGAKGDFIVGYNQAWIGADYGHDLTDKFDAAKFASHFAGIRAAGGSVVRLFLFTARQGIQYRNSVITGIDATLLQNLAKVLKLAREHQLQVYVTGFTGAEAIKVQDEWRQFYFKMFTDAQALAAYHTLVLAPVLNVLNQSAATIYAFDLMNEIDSLTAEFFPMVPENNVRWWVSETRKVVKLVSPWLKVTASVGYGGAQDRLTMGMMSGLGLDFYDLHIYSDSGRFSGATALCNRTRLENMPIILGEFGQKTERLDDTLQLSATATFLYEAQRLCFAGAFAWVFDHSATTPWWSYRRADGSLRPAGNLIAEFAKGLPKP